MKSLPTTILLILFLSACSADVTPLPIDPQPSPTLSESSTRVDEQGTIVIEITPRNLDAPADTLEFDVVMNTHSVDLSMDLATVATLSTDTGISLPAREWDAPRGGHHLEGRLVFPAMNDGKPVLEGASKVTLTLINLDVPRRVFEWELK